MRIDGTFGIEPQGRAQRETTPAGTHRKTEPDPNRPTPDDPQIRYLQEAYLEKAATVEDINPQAVAEARELLDSGQLDTPEAVQRAVQAIFRLGA